MSDHQGGRERNEAASGDRGPPHDIGAVYQNRGHVGTKPEKANMTEREIAGETAQQVPAKRQRRIHEKKK